jgi:hypothetical protein
VRDATSQIAEPGCTAIKSIAISLFAAGSLVAGASRCTPRSGDQNCIYRRLLRGSRRIQFQHRPLTLRVTDDGQQTWRGKVELEWGGPKNQPTDDRMGPILCGADERSVRVSLGTGNTGRRGAEDERSGEDGERD